MRAAACAKSCRNAAGFHLPIFGCADKPSTEKGATMLREQMLHRVSPVHPPASRAVAVRPARLITLEARREARLEPRFTPQTAA
jgi:hypothetical protein